MSDSTLPIPQSELEDLEIRLLLEGVYARYGYDFRDYSPATLQRRIRSNVEAEGVGTISGLLAKVLHDCECMERFLLRMMIHVTSMFRDPAFYRAFRQKVVDHLRTYPFIRIWHAGCSSGEEVYSMAILLEEEGLLSRCRIYATDLSEAVLRVAKRGSFPLAFMKEYTENYIAAGGQRPFSDYYTADQDYVVFRSSLRESMVFAEHNLATDGSFNEFNVILCRNVLIYFNPTLQERVHKLFYTSLAMLGVLALGGKETLRFTPHEANYEEVDGRAKIWKKVR